MCSQVRCQTCGKPTWTGCGAHIEQALRNVPVDQRCKCRQQAESSPQGEPKKRGFLGLF